MFDHFAAGCSPSTWGVTLVTWTIEKALTLYRGVAVENAHKRKLGRNDWDGIAFRLDPATYGQ
jgi:hypothetical protein